MTIGDLLAKIASFTDLDQPVTLRMRTLTRDESGFPQTVTQVTDFKTNWAIGDTGNPSQGLCIYFDYDKGEDAR